MIKVKIPRKINIGAYQYNIRYEKGLTKYANSTGLCFTGDATILISPDELPQVRDATLIHELLHCISDVERLEYTEKDIDRVAHCLIRILRDNFDITFDWSEFKEVMPGNKS